MIKINKRSILISSIVFFLICLAIFIRNMDQFMNTTPKVDFITSILRGLIYVILFSAWNLSLRRRIVQIQARHYLTAVSALMVFWIVVRTLKYMFFNETHIGRYLWYLYYFPMIFIPLLALFIALSMGKAEKFRIPKYANILFILSTLLLILVLTNDYHQIVFKFPSGHMSFENGEYTHHIGYYIIIVWIVICAVTGFAFIVVKSRVPYSKRRVFLPCIPLAMLVIYAVLYVIMPDFLHPIAGDMTVTTCILTSSIFELCIQSGLIQSNSHYYDLFKFIGMGMMITDEDYNILLSSTETEPISEELMRKIETEPVMMNDGFRLCSASIKIGHIMWLEDVSKMNKVIERLADTSEYLTTRGVVLHKEVETRREEQRLTEQNRLYNRLMNDNEAELKLFSDLISQIELTNNINEEKKLTAKLAVVCTHIKRRGNLLFISEKGDEIDGAELRFALNEWISNLRLCEVNCNLFFNINFTLSFSQTVALYDTLQRVLLYTLDTLHSLLVTVSERNGEPYMVLNMCCDCDLSNVSNPNVSISEEDDGEWVIVINIQKGSAAS